MKMAYWLSAAIGVAALGLTATEAPAASLSGAESLKTVVGETSNVQGVHWRRRHWRHHWYPRHHYGYPYYRDYYYGGYPYYYRRHHYHGPRFGVWGPGFGFYVGPRRHRYWW